VLEYNELRVCEDAGQVADAEATEEPNDDSGGGQGLAGALQGSYLLSRDVAR